MLCIHFETLLLVLIHDLGRDTVQISLTVCCDSSSTIIILLQYADRFQALEDLSLYGARCDPVVSWTGATVDPSTESLSESSNANTLVQIDVASDGCSVYVVPVWIIWSKFLVCSGFYSVDPFWDWEFA